MKQGLRTNQRVMLAGLIPMIVLAMILTGYLVNAHLDEQQQAFEHQGTAFAQELSESSRYGLFIGDILYLTQEVSKFLDRTHVYRVEVIDRDGNTLVDSLSDVTNASQTRLAVFEETVLSIRVDTIEDELVFSEESPRVDGAATLGKVRVSLTYAGVHADNQKTIRNSIVILVISLVIASVMLWLVSSYITRPIDRITEAVNDARLGRFDSRVPEQSSGELGKLEAGINTMLHELSQHKEELERKIEGATRTLQERNAQLDRARTAAITASKVKSEFLAHMSHEIRTPMNGILGFVDLLGTSELDKQQRAHLDVINRSAKDLLAVINQILDFSKIESGKVELRNRPVNLRELVTSISHLFMPQAHQKNLRFSLDIDKKLPDELLCDQVRIRQIVANLISNAVKYTNEGTVDVKLQVKENDGETCRLAISVSDTGIGISGTELGKLFDPFTQADIEDRQLYQGTGLGLAIVKHLVETMEGEIDVRSEVGAGSCFEVSLALRMPPSETRRLEGMTELDDVLALVTGSQDAIDQALLQQLENCGCHYRVVDEQSLDGEDASLLIYCLPQQSERMLDELPVSVLETGLPLIVYGVPALHEQAERLFHHHDRDLLYLPKPVATHALQEVLLQVASMSRRSLVSSSHQLDGLKVLAADDNEINRHLLNNMLISCGAKVTNANNGIEAFEAAKTGHFDIIFMDIHMPVMNGIEASREIRALPAYTKVPIIALSADVVSKERIEREEPAIDRYLTKPVTIEELLEVIRALCGDASSEEDPAAATSPGMQEQAAATPLEAELRQLFKKELPGLMEAVESGFQTEDWEHVRETLHKMKGAAGVCRLENFYDHVSHLQELVNSDDQETAFAALSRLQQAARDVMR